MPHHRSACERPLPSIRLLGTSIGPGEDIKGGPWGRSGTQEAAERSKWSPAWAPCQLWPLAPLSAPLQPAKSHPRTMTHSIMHARMFQTDQIFAVVRQQRRMGKVLRPLLYQDAAAVKVSPQALFRWCTPHFPPCLSVARNLRVQGFHVHRPCIAHRDQVLLML